MGKKQPVNRGNKRAASGLALPLRDAALASQGYFGSRTRNQPKLERRRATQRHPINQQKSGATSGRRTAFVRQPGLRRDSNPLFAARCNRKLYHEVAPTYGTQKIMKPGRFGTGRRSIEAPAGNRSGQRLPLRGQPFA
jgi:hypothetical protein